MLAQRIWIEVTKWIFEHLSVIYIIEDDDILLDVFILSIYQHINLDKLQPQMNI